VYAFFYKFLNPHGKVVIKCDGSDNLYPFANSGFKTKLIYMLIRKLKIIDLILAEHISLVDFFNAKKIPALHCPNGVSADYYQVDRTCERDSVPTVIFVGKCGDERKNAEEVVMAVAELNFDCKVLFLGGETTTFHNWFERRMEKYPIDVKSRFNFLGFLDNPLEVISCYDKAHVFLMTSLHEGYPLSLSQAAWRECFPILSTNAGGADMKSAGCAEIYSNIEDLIVKLKLALTDLETTRFLGQNALEYAKKNNDWRVTVKKIKERLDNE
jgi:glycosyltransferase involved in cell wall biosynthesis